MGLFDFFNKDKSGETTDTKDTTDTTTNNDEKTDDSKESTGGGLLSDSTFWSSAIAGGVSLVDSFNYKKQENELAIAQANADAERSKADSSNSENAPKTGMIILGILVVVVVGFFIVKYLRPQSA